MDIKTFATLVRKLIFQLAELKQENAGLKVTIQQLKDEKAKSDQVASDLQREYNSLLTGKILSITDNDIETSKQRVNNMIRTIDRCIKILSEK